MSSQSRYCVPIEGLVDGNRKFEYRLGPDFFESHPYGIISKGDVLVALEFAKESGGFKLHFQIEGNVQQDCDRCLRDLQVPIQGEKELLLRLGEGEDDAEVAYVERDSHSVDLEPFLYEFVSLCVPMQTVCEEFGEEDCPEEILQMIKTGEKVEEKKQKMSKPFKEALKNIKIDKK